MANMYLGSTQVDTCYIGVNPGDGAFLDSTQVCETIVYSHIRWDHQSAGVVATFDAPMEYSDDGGGTWAAIASGATMTGPTSGTDQMQMRHAVGAPPTFINFAGQENMQGKVTLLGNSLTTAKTMFHNCKNITEVDMVDWDTSNIKSFNYFMGDCWAITVTPDISKWKFDSIDTNDDECWASTFMFLTSITSPIDVTYLNNVLHGSLRLMLSGWLLSTTAPDVSNWDVSRVTSLEYLFNKQQLASPAPDVSNWNTSNVTNMGHIFTEYGVNLTARPSTMAPPDVSNWDTSSATNFWGIFGEMACYEYPIMIPIGPIWDMSSAVLIQSVVWELGNNSRIADLQHTNGMENWDIGNLNIAGSMAALHRHSRGWTPASYNELLVKWDAQAPNPAALTRPRFSDTSIHDTTSGGYNGSVAYASLCTKGWGILHDGGTAACP